MTTTLAFDTCLGALSVAIARSDAEGGRLLARAFERRAIGHAEALVPVIARVLGEAGLDIADIDRLAVTLGPGSFTGLRVGIAAARGLALARGLPVVGTTSLAVMAATAANRLDPGEGADTLAVVVDARRDQHYVELFGFAALETGAEAPWPVSRGAPKLLAMAEVVRLITTPAVLLVGSGAAAIAAACDAAGLRVAAALPDLEPDAAALARVAHALAPLDTVEPLYIREPDAKAPSPSPLA